MPLKKGLEIMAIINWLPRMESNHDSQIQNLKSYRLDDRAITVLKSIAWIKNRVKGIIGECLKSVHYA